MRRIGWSLAGLVWCAGVLLAQPTAGPSNSTGDPVVRRFLERADEPLAGYRALRRLEARNDRFDLHGWMEAWTELSPAGLFTYQIVREGGSDYIRTKVLRPLLDNEERLLETRNASRSAVTPDNYVLRGSEAAEPGLVKLLVSPKRRDVSLIEGAVFVTEEDADLVRVEGRLSKNPSFWTRRVDVVRHYDRIGGARVPVRLDSVAQIRFAGTSTLSMTWDYEAINGIPVTKTTAARPHDSRDPRRSRDSRDFTDRGHASETRRR